MRLFLLPISTRRTLIYCERVKIQLAPDAKPPITERIITKVSETWAKWERAEKGWQKKITVYGEQLFRRIPYEEWGLKSLPPATKARLKEAEEGKLGLKCLYPGTFVTGTRVLEILRHLATERQALHRKRMWWCILGAPVTIPFALVPVIPNIPFFYLCFRAYSHYRALYGGRMLEHLVSKDLVRATDSSEMDEAYTAGLLYTDRQGSRDAVPPTAAEIERVVKTVEAQTQDGKEEVMLLRRWNGKLIAEAFKLPQMEVEIERAVEQVEKAIKAKEELVEEKQELEQATGKKVRPTAEEVGKENSGRAAEEK